MTSVLFRPCATVVRARNTSAIPPVPILRISVYFPNCSLIASVERSLARSPRALPVLCAERVVDCSSQAELPRDRVGRYRATLGTMWFAVPAVVATVGLVGKLVLRHRQGQLATRALAD